MIVVLIGPPGVGKGTQCKRLAEYLNVPHLSTGDMLRDAKARDTELGRLAAGYMDHGKLVPDSVVVDVIGERLSEDDCQRGCLLDGFPRTVAQAKALEEILQQRELQLGLVLELTAGTDELVKRLLRRAELENRADDTPAAIKHRLEVFRQQTAPVIDYYSHRGLLKRVDGTLDPDGVFAQIKKCVDRAASDHSTV